MQLCELTCMEETEWAGKKLYHYEELDSTNNKAKELAEAGEVHGAVVMAEMQTAGRGRRGRQWESPKGEGLLFSMILKPEIPPDRASMLTLVAAVAITKAISKRTGLRPQIKWPNDIVLSGKKVCGILTEMSIRGSKIAHIILGIGINLKQPQFPGELEEIATTIKREFGREISREQLLEDVLKEFEHYYGKYLETMDLSRIQEEYNACLVNLGRQVTVLDPKGAYEGVAKGITVTGELLVQRENHMIAVNAGEVSVRGIYGYV